MIELFPHQIKSLEELRNIERSNYKTCIFSDMTGFGKTITVMNLIKETNDRWIPCDTLYKTSTFNPEMIKLRDIYVVPNHLFKQVCTNAKKCGVNYLSISTLNTNFKYNNIDQNVDVLIIGSYIIDNFSDSAACFPWYRIIIDEADTIKYKRINTHFAESIHFRHLLLMSATLRSGDGISIMDKLIRTNGLERLLSKNKNLTDIIQIRNSDTDIINYFQPLFNTREFTYKVKQSDLIDSILRHVPNIKDELLQGDIELAIKRLGGFSKNIANCAVIYLEKRIKNEPYNNALKERLKHIKDDIAAIIKDPCIICYENKNEPAVTPCCQNILCVKCLLEWISTSRSTCPFCRSLIDLNYITTKNLLFLKKDSEEYKDIERVKNLPTTEEVIDHILENFTNKNKILIYSSLKLDPRVLVRNNKLRADSISGSIYDCERILRSFYNNSINCLLLDAKKMAAGLDLEITTDIIIIGSYTPDILTQIKGRALRLNRPRDLRLNIHFIEWG